MNTFYEHHHDSIRFAYRCFDRILLNGLIQPFQQPERVIGFFNTYRNRYPVSKMVLRDIATQYQHWVSARAARWGVSILDAPAEQRRDVFVEPYFRGAKPDQVVVILKAGEPAWYLVAIGKDDRWQFGIQTALADPVQLLCPRPRLGPAVRPPFPYFPLLGAHLPQSAPLARPSTGGRGDRVPPGQQHVSELRRPGTAPGARRCAHAARSRTLRAEVAAAPRSILYPNRTPVCAHRLFSPRVAPLRLVQTPGQTVGRTSRTYPAAGRLSPLRPLLEALRTRLRPTRRRPAPTRRFGCPPD